LVPFSGRGASHEADALTLNWAIASGGAIQLTRRLPLHGFAYGYGRPPYATCAASGYRYPRRDMTMVDGRLYIPAFAPAPKESF
jgi:hypothetical protein